MPLSSRRNLHEKALSLDPNNYVSNVSPGKPPVSGQVSRLNTSYLQFTHNFYL